MQNQDFHYIFEKPVNVFNDHKTLEDIYRKPFPEPPIYRKPPKPLPEPLMHIQKMHLHLQWYYLKSRIIEARDTQLCDTLSRARLSDCSPKMEGLESISMIGFVPITYEKYAEIRQCTIKELSFLIEVIRQRWPYHRLELLMSVQPYWDSRSELAICDGTVYKRLCILVPPSMCDPILKMIHKSHLEW